MEESILIQIQTLRNDLEHLKADVDKARSGMMDLYLKAENTASLPSNRNTLTDTLASIDREMETQRGNLDKLEAQANDIYISPGATDESTEDMLERMHRKTQAADQMDTLTIGLKQVNTTIGGLMKQVHEVTKEVEQGSASQELAALKAKLGLGKKKLGE